MISLVHPAHVKRYARVGNAGNCDGGYQPLVRTEASVHCNVCLHGNCHRAKSSPSLLKMPEHPQSTLVRQSLLRPKVGHKKLPTLKSLGNQTQKRAQRHGQQPDRRTEAFGHATQASGGGRSPAPTAPLFDQPRWGLAHRIARYQPDQAAALAASATLRRQPLVASILPVRRPSYLVLVSTSVDCCVAPS